MAEARRLTKNEKRRLREKEAAAKAKVDEAATAGAASQKEKEDAAAQAQRAKRKRVSRFAEQPSVPVVVEYVSADLEQQAASGASGSGSGLAEADLAAFKEVFSKFARPEDLTTASRVPGTGSGRSGSRRDIFVDVGDGSGSDGSDMETDDAIGGGSSSALTKRQRRLLARPTVAQLKQLVARPELVEAHDVTAADPLLLLQMKSVRNSVPVPAHWAHKRKYLSGKRGVEKPPFELPAFIADTGIDRIRQSLMEAEEGKRAKAKARSQVRPSMGKVDIDYQVLHDAFFKYQTKPELSAHGELYFEGKEGDNAANKSIKAGDPLSETLRAALGMSVDEGAAAPPPWLTHQQRYGPPPSYPHLKIPGLSAPIPHGGSFGYHNGGWGRPPVDEYGRPLYGDVFGAGVGIDEGQAIVNVGALWGEVRPAEDSDSDSDSDSDAGAQEQVMGDPTASAAASVGLEGPTGLAATMTAEELERLAEQTIDLRKRTGGAGTATSVAGRTGTGGTASPQFTLQKDPTELFTEVQTRVADPIKSGELFASSSTYVLAKGGVGGDEEGAAAAPAAAVDSSGGTASVHPVPAKKVRRGPPARETDNFKF